MMKFNAGALRPAAGDARSARLDAANDLVRRTLAQHGLMAGGDTRPIGVSMPSMPSMPSMDSLISKMAMGGTGLGGTASEPAIPEGAVFRRDTYSGAAGQRSYRTYVPSTAKDGVTGVVMMLHGCTQGPEDFAIGTGMNALAEVHGFVVVYPLQSRGENAQSCWNWFRRGDQMRDRGEPAILAGIATAVAAEFSVCNSRTFVAGLSAGAAMAVILGETYGDVFAAVGAHSGLPFGAAKDVPSAFAAMAGSAGVGAMPLGAASVPTIIFHGTADTTVHPSNADQIARNVTDRGDRQTVETEDRSTIAGRDVVRRIATATDGTPRLEQWTVSGLGHAWSGGKPGGTYTDAAGPDASAEMIRFFFDTPSKDI